MQLHLTSSRFIGAANTTSTLDRSSTRVWLVAVLVIQLLGSARAAEFPAHTLEQAQRIALEKNWDQLAADRDVAIADAQRDTAKEFQNPTLSFSSTNVDTRGTNQTVLGNGLWDRSYDTVVSLSQPLEIGGKRLHRYASSTFGYKAALAKRADSKRVFLLSVVQAYAAAALAQEIEQLTSDCATHLKKEAELADVRFRSGDIAESDLSQIAIAARQLELQAGAAQANAAALRIQLACLLGDKNPNHELKLVDQLEALAELPPPSVTTAEINRADLVAAEHSARKAEEDLRLQKAQRIPDPTVLV